MRYAAIIMLIAACTLSPTSRERLPFDLSTGDASPVITTALNAWEVWRDGHDAGTAFPIGSKKMAGVWQCYFLTAKHLLSADVVHYEVRLGDDHRQVHVMGVHPSRDLAVLVCNHQDRPEAVTLGPVPAFGDVLYAAGYPMARSVLRITRGYAGSVAGSASVPLAPGNSGGPIIDALGRAVGVARSIRQMPVHPMFRDSIWHVSNYAPVDFTWLREMGVLQ